MNTRLSITSDGVEKTSNHFESRTITRPAIQYLLAITTEIIMNAIIVDYTTAVDVYGSTWTSEFRAPICTSVEKIGGNRRTCAWRVVSHGGGRFDGQVRYQ